MHTTTAFARIRRGRLERASRSPARLAVTISALSLVVAACGANETADSGAGGAEGDVNASIAVGVDSENFMTNMPLYVGLEKGFFAEFGIEDVEITVTGDQFVSALLSDSVDISHGATLDWFAAGEASGEEIRWLGTLRDAELLQLGVRPGIESAEDLKGGKVTGGPAGSANEANLRVVLDEIGLSEDDVEIVPTNPGSDAWLAAVLSGQLDGAMLFARHIAPLEEAGGTFLYQDLRQVPQDGFVTTASYLDENEATVRAFLAGLITTKEWYSDPANKDEVLQIMADNGFDTSKLERSYQPELDQQSPDAGFELEDMDSMIERGVENEQIPDGTDWHDYVDLGLLREAQQEAGVTPRPADGP